MRIFLNASQTSDGRLRKLYGNTSHPPKDYGPVFSCLVFFLPTIRKTASGNYRKYSHRENSCPLTVFTEIAPFYCPTQCSMGCSLIRPDYQKRPGKPWEINRERYKQRATAPLFTPEDGIDSVVEDFGAKEFPFASHPLVLA